MERGEGGFFRFQVAASRGQACQGFQAPQERRDTSQAVWRKLAQGDAPQSHQFPFEDPRLLPQFPVTEGARGPRQVVGQAALRAFGFKGGFPMNHFPLPGLPNLLYPKGQLGAEFRHQGPQALDFGGAVRLHDSLPAEVREFPPPGPRRRRVW